MRFHLSRWSGLALPLLFWGGCDDALVMLRNDDSTSVHILAPGETASEDNLLGANQSRDVSVEIGTVLFRAVRNGAEIGSTECGVADPTLFEDPLVVIWNGTALVCFYPDPFSGTSAGGRAIHPLELDRQISRSAAKR